jgi:hypothetical protein
METLLEAIIEHSRQMAPSGPEGGRHGLQIEETVELLRRRGDTVVRRHDLAAVVQVAHLYSETVRDEGLGRIVTRLQVALDMADAPADRVDDRNRRSSAPAPTEDTPAGGTKAMSAAIDCLLAEGVAPERVIDVVLDSTTPRERWSIAREAIICDVAARLCNDLDTPPS